VDVKAVCTNSALPLVGIQALQTVTGNTVYTDDLVRGVDMAHIELAKWGDYLLICPATANTMAKIAHGIADNLLTALALSFENRLVIAPAMNVAMWQNTATRDNIALLVKHGAHVLPVGIGELACGDSGPGRLIDHATIVDFMASLASPKWFARKKVLISSGPTVEPLDDVRVITNRSSGKMGSALARAAWLAGAQVTVVSGPANAPLPTAVRIIRVSTALEMQEAMEKEFSDSDVCILAAAVADFRPAQPATGKMHREENESLSIPLIANPDIAEGLGKRKTRQFLVGFALESPSDGGRAIDKMKRKNCDMMVVNLTNSSMEKDTGLAHIMYPDASPDYLPQLSKQELGVRILERIAKRLGLTNG
jgi:phosphopantothenoylcysteine decarboxylase / phosphopantothenate---cysteine ligase